MKIKSWAWIKHENTEEASIIFADSVEYIEDKQGEFFDHHLMFFSGKKLIFKVYLPNDIKDKPFESVQEACKSVGILIKENDE